MQDQPGSGRRSAREPRPGAQRGWSPLAGRAISPLPHHGDQPGSPPVHAATTCWVSLPDISRYRRGLPHPDPAPGPVMPPGPDLAEGAPKRRLPHPRVLLRRNRASPIKWLAARSAGAAISARPVSDSKLRPLRRRHSQRASSRSAHRACMTMHDQPVPKTHVFAAVRAVCRAEDRVAPVFGANVCDAPGAAFVRSGRVAIVVGGVHPPRNQSAVTAAIALISRSAPGTARPVTRAAVTSGGAPARASRGAIAP